MRLKHMKNFFYCLLICTSINFVIAQDNIENTNNTDAAAAIIVQPGFKDIVLGNGPVNLLIWVMIFSASFATLTLIYDGFSIIKKSNLLPETLISSVNAALERNDIPSAINLCENSPGPLASVLSSGISSLENGTETARKDLESAVELENEKILQRISYLNLCGQISPMLGLLGTVIGMVKAFSSLAGQAGAAKAQLLALAISGALWTTVAGLLISVPAIVFYTVYKNIAIKRLIESQAIATSIINRFTGYEYNE